LNWNDYGARNYDPALGRAFAIDPHADLYFDTSPFAFFANNPVNTTDPTGMDPEDPKKEEPVDGGTLPEVVVTAKRTQTSVGEPGFAESLIPIWGSGRTAINDFQNGRIGWGIVNTVAAVSDVFLVKSLITAAGKLVVKGGLKIAAKSFCFTEDTEILTSKGFKPIKDISDKDSVWAYEIESKKHILKPVITTFVRQTDTIIKIYVAGELIKVTPEHPFFVKGSWIQACDLRQGDKLTTHSGKFAVIDSLILKDTTVNVYNFEVSDLHNYYVTQRKILVHNTCGFKTLWNSLRKTARKGVRDADAKKSALETFEELMKYDGVTEYKVIAGTKNGFEYIKDGYKVIVRESTNGPLGRGVMDTIELQKSVGNGWQKVEEIRFLIE
jgi:hypothetical protein